MKSFVNKKKKSQTRPTAIKKSLQTDVFEAQKNPNIQS